jgi:hypothetical protein
MQKFMVYKTAQVMWCCFSMIVAILCYDYECLYNALYLCSSKFSGPQKAPHWVRASPASLSYIAKTEARMKLTVYSNVECV